MHEMHQSNSGSGAAPPPPPSGTININAGSITFTLYGSSFNTVVLNFSFGGESVGSTQLQPPTMRIKGSCSNSNGSFEYDLTLQPPAGQNFGNLIANNLAVTPAGQDPVYLTGTTLVTWSNTGTIISQYGN
ncbi:MAG TPA: hypothetical protein VJ183_10420 [Chloroflexia bacterium]|nr:hypothetical protein [Chloroflexia bacterium]